MRYPSDIRERLEYELKNHEIKVCYWRGNGPLDTGHVALQTEKNYCSLWPDKLFPTYLHAQTESPNIAQQQRPSIHLYRSVDFASVYLLILHTITADKIKNNAVTEEVFNLTELLSQTNQQEVLNDLAWPVNQVIVRVNKLSYTLRALIRKKSVYKRGELNFKVGSLEDVPSRLNPLCDDIDKFGDLYEENRDPDEIAIIPGLDVDKINACIETLKAAVHQDRLDWSLFNLRDKPELQNCSGIVSYILLEGGINDKIGTYRPLEIDTKFYCKYFTSNSVYTKFALLELAKIGGIVWPALMILKTNTFTLFVTGTSLVLLFQMLVNDYVQERKGLIQQISSKCFGVANRSDLESFHYCRLGTYFSLAGLALGIKLCYFIIDWLNDIHYHPLDGQDLTEEALILARMLAYFLLLSPSLGQLAVFFLIKIMSISAVRELVSCLPIINLLPSGFIALNFIFAKVSPVSNFPMLFGGIGESIIRCISGSQYAIRPCTIYEVSALAESVSGINALVWERVSKDRESAYISNVGLTLLSLFIANQFQANLPLSCFLMSLFIIAGSLLRYGNRRYCLDEAVIKDSLKSVLEWNKRFVDKVEQHLLNQGESAESIKKEVRNEIDLYKNTWRGRLAFFNKWNSDAHFYYNENDLRILYSDVFDLNKRDLNAFDPEITLSRVTRAQNFLQDKQIYEYGDSIRLVKEHFAITRFSPAFTCVATLLVNFSLIAMNSFLMRSQGIEKDSTVGVAILSGTALITFILLHLVWSASKKCCTRTSENPNNLMAPLIEDDHLDEERSSSTYYSSLNKY